jgi:zinc protease
MIRPLALAGALCGLAFAVPAAAPAQPAPLAAPPAVRVPPIGFTVRTLPNGLKVYSSLDRSTSDVTIQVFYDVGAKDDPPGRSGFAHLFEHMMFKATRDMPAEFMDRLTEDVGGENNASTHDDFTEYHEVVPASQLERLLWAESQRMSTLVVDEDNFKSERSVVEEELRQRVLADPYGRLFALYIPEDSFSVHPYRRPPIGSIEDLDAATIDDVRAFHATYYRPDNASLIVIGNFDQARLDAWVDKYFGPIKDPDWAMPRVTAVEPPRAGPRSVDAYGPNVPLPAVVLTWLATSEASADAPALGVLETILGGGDSSRLNQDLVHDQQLAAQVMADADLRQQPGLFAVAAVMASGKTPDQGEAALRAEIARVRDQPVTQAELDRAKTQLIAANLRERETVEGQAQALGESIVLEGDANRVNDDIARLQAVTAADVQRVARLYLPDDRRAVIRYQDEAKRPAGAAAPSGAAASPPVAASPLPGAKAPIQTQAPPDQRQAPPPAGPPVEASLPTPVERTLKNGLRVIVARSTGLPLVSAELVVRTGGASDPSGKAGLADMTATLLTKGAGARDANQVARDIEALGGSLEAGATWDGSEASLSVLSANLQPAMAIFADAVRRPTLAEGELERARMQAMDDLTVALRDPSELSRYVTSVAVFGGGPYGHVLSGSPASLKRITRQDATAFHQAWYRPDNAVLVLTGDIAPEQGFALAERAFGDWAAPAASLPQAQAAPAPSHPRVIVVDLPGAGQAAVSMAIPGIRRADPRYYQAVVANEVLGGGYSSWLNEEIRIKRGLSYGAGSAIDARRMPGAFVARVQTKNQSAPEVADLMIQQLKRLGAAPAEGAEVQARQAALTGNYGRNLETTQGLASTLAIYALQDIPLTEIQRYEGAVRQVTPAQAASFAAATLDPSKADLIVVGDAKQFLPQLKTEHPDLEVIPAAQLDLDSPSLRQPSPAKAQSRQATGATRRSRRSASATRP